MSARRHSSSTPRLRPYSQPTAPRPSGSTASDFDRVSVHFRRFPVHSKPIPPPECTENYLPVHFPGGHGAVRHPTWRYRAARPWPTIRIFPSATNSWINRFNCLRASPEMRRTSEFERGSRAPSARRRITPSTLARAASHSRGGTGPALRAAVSRARVPSSSAHRASSFPLRSAVVLLHDDDASGPFRHLDIFDDRRQLGIRAVVHRRLQPIQVHLGRHSAYGLSASQDSVGHAEHHRSAPAVRHADRPLDRRTETPPPVPDPLFESQILILQVVRHAMVESLEEFLDLRNRSRKKRLPSPRPADREPTARIVGGAGHRAG